MAFGINVGQNRRAFEDRRHEDFCIVENNARDVFGLVRRRVGTGTY